MLRQQSPGFIFLLTGMLWCYPNKHLETQNINISHSVSNWIRKSCMPVHVPLNLPSCGVYCSVMPDESCMSWIAPRDMITHMPVFNNGNREPDSCVVMLLPVLRVSMSNLPFQSGARQEMTEEDRLQCKRLLTLIFSTSGDDEGRSDKCRVNKRAERLQQISSPLISSAVRSQHVDAATCWYSLLHWFKWGVVEYINIFVIMSLFPFDLGHFLPVPSPFWLHVFYSLLYMSPSSWINTASSLSEPPKKLIFVFLSLMSDKANEFKTATLFPLLVLLIRCYSSASLPKLWIFNKGFPVRAPGTIVFSPRLLCV